MQCNPLSPVPAAIAFVYASRCVRRDRLLLGGGCVLLVDSSVFVCLFAGANRLSHIRSTTTNFAQYARQLLRGAGLVDCRGREMARF